MFFLTGIIIVLSVLILSNSFGKVVVLSKQGQLTFTGRCANFLSCLFDTSRVGRRKQQLGFSPLSCCISNVIIMATGALCGVAPFLFRKKSSGCQGRTHHETSKTFDATKLIKKMRRSTIRNSSGVAGNFVTQTELRNKILTFRDLLDFSPVPGSASANELLVWTLNDLYKLHPNFKPKASGAEIQKASLQKALVFLCNALKSLGDMWTTGPWMAKCKYDPTMKLDLPVLERTAVSMLEDVIKLARERLFSEIDEDEDDDDEEEEEEDEEEEEMREYRPQMSPFGKALNGSCSENSMSFPGSPATPTSVLTQARRGSGKSDNMSYSPPQFLTLRVHSVGKLNPIDLKRLSFHMLPHAIAQDPSISKQISKPQQDQNREPEVNEVKEAATVKLNQADEIMDDLENTEEVAKTGPAKVNAYIRRNHIDGLATPSPSTLHDLTRQELNVHPLSPELPKLQSQVEEPVASSLSLPLPSSEVETNIKVQPIPDKVSPEPSSLSPSMILLHVTSVPPPPPPPPMESRSVLELSPPPPPPPSPMAMSTLAPPPPPPPLTTACSPPPPPPPMATSGGLIPPPPPPLVASKGSIPPPPPPMGSTPLPPPPLGPLPPPPFGKGDGPIPLPPGAGGALRRKAASKLKRSAQMASLYRFLKGKIEGSGQEGKLAGRKRGQVGAPAAGGKQGMADALAEMTKRSAYFIQIEEDVKNYSEVIKEMKIKISSFETSDMKELKQFHSYVESHLEKLTDETQVLARFEDFPGKKLEALRMAAALYTKLDAIVNTLQNWPIVSPANQLLDKVESYFNKIKQELDALERTKDEDAKRLQSQKITFDFGILVRIKELVVDISSHCMELVIKEKREASASGKTLWKAFQFAYRVYTFAGGHDERADKLTRELAQEIETEPLH